MVDIYEQYTTEEASKILDMPVDTLRHGIQQGLFPFAVAVKKKEYSYFIFKERLHKYMRGELR